MSGAADVDVLDAQAVEAPSGPQPAFVDLAPFLDDGYEPERPSVGPIEGGKHLFYSKRLNSLNGEPGLGKTNITLAVVVTMLSTGSLVLYLDPEDTPEGIVRRLLAFGADPQRILEKFRYLHNPDPAEVALAIKWADSTPPDLVIIDGLAEFLAGSGVDENSAGETLQFMRRAIRPFAECGAAVVVTDHVSKDKDGRGRWPRGTSAKLGRYDGAVYQIVLVEGYSPDKPGSVKLVVSKDRCGGVGPAGSVAAHISFEPLEDEGGTLVRIRPHVDDFRPTELMAKVVRELSVNPSASLRDLRALGKSEWVKRAIDCLVKDGKLIVESAGRGKPNRYILT